MEYVLAVTVVESFKDLLENVFGNAFVKLAPLPYIGEQVSTSTQLLHIEEVSVCFEGLI